MLGADQKSCVCRDWDQLVRSTVLYFSNPIVFPQPCKTIGENGWCRDLIDAGLNIAACGCSCASVIAQGGYMGGAASAPEPEPEPPEPEPEP